MLAFRAYAGSSLVTTEMQMSDLETKGMIAEFVSIEIGALGHWLPHTRFSLQQQVPQSLSKSAATHLLDSAAKAVVTASHTCNILCSSKPIMELT